MTFPTRVAVRASEIRLSRILLTILAVPFYVLGFVVGVLWVAVGWCIAAGAVAFSDVRDRSGGRVTDGPG